MTARGRRESKSLEPRQESVRRVISLILEQCSEAEERYEGYREDLLETVGDILMQERKWQMFGERSGQKIQDKLAALADLVYGHGEPSVSKDLGDSK